MSRNRYQARKSWAQALFELGAIPPQVANGNASHHDVAESVRRVEEAEQKLRRHEKEE